MPAGTPTDSDSYWLGQSAVFSHRVQTELMKTLENVAGETPTGLTGAIPTLIHNARASFVKTVTNPSAFPTWLAQFITAAAADANVISAATNASVTYTPITSAALGDVGAAEGGLLTSAILATAIASSFDTFVPGI
jgi:hypothetical protein